VLGRITATAGVFALVAVFVPDPLFAQCGAGYLALEPLVSGDTVAVAFLGTAVRVERVGTAEIATFTAERVWKGPVTRQMTVYRPIPSPPEPPARRPDGGGWAPGEFAPTIFERSNRYVVVAHRLSDAERTRLGADERTAAFGTNVCGDGSRPLSAAAGPDLAALGPGRAPIDQQSPVRANVAAPIKIVDVAPVRPVLDGRIQGVVVLEIAIDETGNVSHPNVLRSIPVLDQAAIECVLKWKYLPALVNGVPSPMVITVTVNFVLL
jgi:protein TonB